MMKMGMKYPAGIGIVVARISIQNCARNGRGDQRAEVIGNKGRNEHWTDGTEVESSQRKGCPCWVCSTVWS